jgi:hypothetical protein
LPLYSHRMLDFPSDLILCPPNATSLACDLVRGCELIRS